jgi:hypothetical protein
MIVPMRPHSILLTLFVALGFVNETRLNADEPKPPEFNFQVVDLQGRPVAGAKVQVWAFAFNGGSGGIDEKTLPAVTTDDNGKVRLVIAAVGDEKAKQRIRDCIARGIRRVALQIEHPLHPKLSEYFDANRADPIVLQDSTMLGIRAHHANDKAPLKRLYPLMNGVDVDWQQADDMLKVRRVDLTSDDRAQSLRVVHIPEHGPAEFSDLIDLNEYSGNPVFIDAIIKPGVRVEGRLSEQVPRPIQRGRVVGHIISGSERSRAYLSVATEINADGSFVFESLPAGETLQLVTLCDAWISSNPTAAQLNAYQAKHNPKGLENLQPSGHDVNPQLIWLAGKVVRPEIAMEPTATCEVTVVDQEGHPIRNATVSFWPNQFFHNAGSSIVGEGVDIFESIREMLKSGDHGRKPYQRSERFTSITNERGVAVVGNLPVGGKKERGAREASFIAQCDSYQIDEKSPGIQRGGFRPNYSAKLSPEETTKITVRMRKVASP